MEDLKFKIPLVTSKQKITVKVNKELEYTSVTRRYNIAGPDKMKEGEYPFQIVVKHKKILGIISDSDIRRAYIAWSFNTNEEVKKYNETNVCKG